MVIAIVVRRGPMGIGIRHKPFDKTNYLMKKINSFIDRPASGDVIANTIYVKTMTETMKT